VALSTAILPAHAQRVGQHLSVHKSWLIQGQSSNGTIESAVECYCTLH